MLNQKIREQIYTIGCKYGEINKIMLFGSRAAGDNDSRSDIDLAIFAPKMKSAEWAQLSLDIEEELDTLLMLDLVKFEDVTVDLQNEILKYGKFLYCKNEDGRLMK